MRRTLQIDEVEYKIAGKNGAITLINKAMQPYAKNAEVNEINGEYWLSYDFDEDRFIKGASYLNGWSHTII